MDGTTFTSVTATDVLVYGVYGLAFFVLGLSIAVRAATCPASVLRRRFLALAGFGFVHAINEWIILAGLVGAPTIPVELCQGIAAASFVFLAYFGLSGERVPRFASSAVIALMCCGWIVAATLVSDAVLLEVITRIGIGVPAALSAAYAFVLDPSLDVTSRRSNWMTRAAALAFIFYAALQVFSSQGDFLPASVFNTANFEIWFGIPCVLARGFSAMIIAGAVVSLLGDFDRMMLTDLELRAAKANLALAESEARLKAFHQSTPECFKTVDAEYRLLDMNPTGLQMIEAESLASVKGQSVLNLVVPEHQERFKEGVAEVFRGVSNRLQFEIVGLAGTRRWMEQSATPLFDPDRPGEVKEMLAVTRDITERVNAERVLSESNRRYEQAQRVANMGSWDWNILTNDLEWSDQIYHIYGLEKGKLPASYAALLERVHPDERAEVEEGVRRALEEGKPYRIEHRIVRPDGCIRIVREQGEVSYNDAGEPIRMLGIVLDVTERREAEQQAREARAWLEEAIESLSEGFMLFDANERLVTCNSTYRRMYEAISDHLVPGMKFEDWARLVAENVAANVAGREDDWVRERMHEFRNPSGPQEYLMSGDQWIRITEYKTPSGGTAGLRVDVTDHKRAEIALQESESRLSSILNSGPDAIITVDQEQRISLFNRAAEEIFGYCAEEMLGEHVERLIPPRFRASHEEQITSFGNSFQGIRREKERGSIFGLRKDGTEFPAEASISKFELNGNPIFTVMLRDITRRQQIEAQLREAKESAEAANIAKSEFLANMSHEIRTPLNGVIGMAETLSRSQDLSDAQSEQIGIIVKSGEILLHLLNGILDLSKIEAGKMELEEADFDLVDLIDSEAEIWSPHMIAKGLDLSVDTSGIRQRMICSDSTRLRQVLTNLIGNAIKFTDAGRISLSVAQHVRDDGSLECRFRIEDTGMGIAPDLLDHVFDKFRQGDTSSTREHGGAGLGLAICQRLVTALGGEISVESLEGEGSTFTFTIVARPATLDAIPGSTLGVRKRADATGAAERPRASVATLRILVVEDNRMNQLVVKTILESLYGPSGVDIDIAGNGAEALEALEDADYDVILMDVQMPVMNGMEATQRIRNMPSAVSQIPIIVLTANAMEGDRETFLASGADDYISKPIDVAALHAAIGRLLGRATDCA